MKDLIARKVVRNDAFRVGVVSFDGKGTWSRTDGETVEGAKQAVDDKVIGSKEGEAPAFRELLPRVCQALGKRFKIVTGDAGLCARENAALVADLGRWYPFGLKGNQPHLHGLTSEARRYDIGLPLARTTDSAAVTGSCASSTHTTWRGAAWSTSRMRSSSGTCARPPTLTTASASPCGRGTS